MGQTSWNASWISSDVPRLRMSHLEAGSGLHNAYMLMHLRETNGLRSIRGRSVRLWKPFGETDVLNPAHLPDKGGFAGKCVPKDARARSPRPRSRLCFFTTARGSVGSPRADGLMCWWTFGFIRMRRDQIAGNVPTLCWGTPKLTRYFFCGLHQSCRRFW